MSTDRHERLESEFALLQAMYPEQVTYNERAREVKYTSNDGAFLLRLPDGYLKGDLPHVLSATMHKQDVRNALKQKIDACDPSEEILDSVILAFISLSESVTAEQGSFNEVKNPGGPASNETSARATIIVYLHHLLNTNKRKQALHPASPGISGLTKPGYPGVLIFAGPATGVREHVNELKQLNWAAFQVRLESEDEWEFAHGKGMKEIEDMGEVVKEIGESRRELFMECMRMK